MKDSILKSIVMIGIILSIVYLSGCVGQVEKPAAKPSVKEISISECKTLCESALSAGEDLGDGPCLSNEVAEGWVCDVAHSPRQAVDNDPANQCSAYRAETAKHFVEVDSSCELIRAV